MPTTYFLLGEPGWYGLLAYALILLAVIGGFVFTVMFIYAKVFRGNKGVTTTNLDVAKDQVNEQR